MDFVAMRSIFFCVSLQHKYEWLTSLATDTCVATAADTLCAHTRSSVQTLCPQAVVDCWRHSQTTNVVESTIYIICTIIKTCILSIEMHVGLFSY